MTHTENSRDTVRDGTVTDNTDDRGRSWSLGPLHLGEEMEEGGGQEAIGLLEHIV